MFSQARNVAISGGTWTQVNHAQSISAFERLQNEVAPGAFHNSGERFDPPRCHRKTRLAVNEKIMNWILGKESTNNVILWLKGAAGAGKSAIAQTTAEQCYEAGLLLGSFFFSRSDPNRNHAKSLFATLAYQIALAISEARPQIEHAIDRDPLVFTRSLEAQMVSLIIEPLQPLVASGYFEDPTLSPRLVIIDGLDEILDLRVQRKLLEIIADVSHRHHLPLIFLVASRPEQQISAAFNSQLLVQLTDHLLLDDTFHPDDDIRLFLDDSFAEIKATHPRRRSIPLSWPSLESVDTLVAKASGQFIYASVVAKFVESVHHRPTDRLEIVLGLRPVRHDLPFAELDALYMHILSRLEDPQRTLRVIGVLLVHQEDSFGSVSSITHIDKFLEFEDGDVESLLSDMTALVSWEERSPHIIHISHASFGDFLFDPLRSGAFTLNRKDMHALMACQCIHYLCHGLPAPSVDDWWAHVAYATRNLSIHLANSTFTEELRRCLRELSWEQLIEDGTTRQSALSFRPEVDGIRNGFWGYSFFVLLYALRGMGLDESEFKVLQDRLFDRPLKTQLGHLAYQMQPSLSFTILIICIFSRMNIPLSSEPCQLLTEWDMVYHLSHVVQKGRFNIWLAMDYPDVGQLNEMWMFFRDSSRSEGYAPRPEAYADASFRCLKYLCRHCQLGAPITPQYNRRLNVEARRNRPWRWVKSVKRVQCFEVHWRHNPRLFFGKTTRLKAYLEPQNEWWKRPISMYRLSDKHWLYRKATLYGLKFLPEALKHAGKSEELVAFITAEKSFSQRALKFPKELKKCKTAMAAYLERVTDDPDAATRGIKVA